MCPPHPCVQSQLVLMRGGCGPRWDRRLEKLHPPALAVSACGGTEWNLPPCLVQAVPGLLRAPAQMLHGEEGGEFGMEAPQRWSRAHPPPPHPTRAPAQHLGLLRIHRAPQGYLPHITGAHPQVQIGGRSGLKFRSPHGHPRALTTQPGLSEKAFIPGMKLGASTRPCILHPILGAPVGIQEPHGGKEAPVMAVALHLIETAHLWTSSCVCPKRVPLSMPSQVTPHQPCGWWEEVPHAETGAWSPTCHCHCLDIP